jgi:hypothetical protein
VCECACAGVGVGVNVVDIVDGRERERVWRACVNAAPMTPQSRGAVCVYEWRV